MRKGSLQGQGGGALGAPASQLGQSRCGARDTAEARLAIAATATSVVHRCTPRTGRPCCRRSPGKTARWVGAAAPPRSSGGATSARHAGAARRAWSAQVWARQQRGGCVGLHPMRPPWAHAPTGGPRMCREPTGCSSCRNAGHRAAPHQPHILKRQVEGIWEVRVVAWDAGQPGHVQLFGWVCGAQQAARLRHGQGNGGMQHVCDSGGWHLETHATSGKLTIFSCRKYSRPTASPTRPPSCGGCREGGLRLGCRRGRGALRSWWVGKGGAPPTIRGCLQATYRASRPQAQLHPIHHGSAAGGIQRPSACRGCGGGGGGEGCGQRRTRLAGLQLMRCDHVSLGPQHRSPDSGNLASGRRALVGRARVGSCACCSDRFEWQTAIRCTVGGKASNTTLCKL